MSDPSPEAIGGIYTAHSLEYLDYRDNSYPWKHIERPAFDKYIPDFYRPDAVILDIGCGAGAIAEHLIKRGCTAANITGIDVSEGLIDEARRRIPEADFQVASADSFELPDAHFDLAVSNMLIHYLNDQQYAAMLERTYRTLKPSGVLFIVDTDPDYDPDSMDPTNIGTYLDMPAPWGGTMPMFIRHPMVLLDRIPYFAGFDVAAGWPLKNQDEERTDTARYAKYSERSGRLAIRFQKVSEAQKQFQLDHRDERAPDLPKRPRA